MVKKIKNKWHRVKNKYTVDYIGNMWQHEIYVQKNDKRYCRMFFFFALEIRSEAGSPTRHRPGLAPRPLLVRDSIECTSVETFASIKAQRTVEHRLQMIVRLHRHHQLYVLVNVKVDIVAVVSATWFALYFLHSDRQKLETTLVCPLLSGSAAHLLTRFVTYSYQFIKSPWQYSNT